MRGDWKDEAMQYRDVDRAAQKKAEEAMNQTRDPILDEHNRIEDRKRMTHHTPTPWKASVIVSGGKYGGHIGIIPGSHPANPPLATLSSGHTERQQGNAAFIVRACNAHDELVAALTEIADKDKWATKYPYGNYECIATDAIGIARAALAKATP